MSASRGEPVTQRDENETWICYLLKHSCVQQLILQKSDHFLWTEMCVYDARTCRCTCTVKLPLMDSLRYRQPIYNGQITCPSLTLSYIELTHYQPAGDTEILWIMRKKAYSQRAQTSCKLYKRMETIGGIIVRFQKSVARRHLESP